jgi:hypothetical protein
MMKSAGIPVLGFLAGCASALFSAWTATLLWGWFIPSLIPAPSILTMMGLRMLLMALFTFARTGRSKYMVEAWLARHRLEQSFSPTAEAVYEMTVAGAILVDGYLLHLLSSHIG